MTDHNIDITFPATEVGIDELIADSSLGTEGAQAIQCRVASERVNKIIASELSARCEQSVELGTRFEGPKGTVDAHTIARFDQAPLDDFVLSLRNAAVTPDTCRDHHIS